MLPAERETTWHDQVGIGDQHSTGGSSHPSHPGPVRARFTTITRGCTRELAWDEIVRLDLTNFTSLPDAGNEEATAWTSS